jgi:TldD protein
MSKTGNSSGGANGVTRREFLAASAQAAAGAALLAAGCRNGRGGTTPGPADEAKEPWPLEAFGVSKETVQRVMGKAMSRGGSFADLYFQRTRYSSLALEDSAVNRARTQINMGVGVRVVRGNETGYAFSESLDEKAMLKAAEVAAAIASGRAVHPPRVFRVVETGRFYPTDPVWAEVAAKTKVDLLMELDKRARAKDRRIDKVMVRFRDSYSHVVIVDSEGRVAVDHRPMTVTSLSCVAEQKGKRESNYYATAARAGMDHYTEETLERLAGEAVRRTVVLFDSVEGPVGEMPVVLAPGSSGILLHEAIGHGMEADFARKKTTIYTDKIGQRIAPKHVTIVDDGTQPGLRGSLNVDDEGRESQRTVLVEGGVFKTFMHDRISAAHFKLEPTGNGRRQSFRHMPVPRMRATYMENGPHDPEEIIRSVKKGIYAVSFTNGQVNIGAGDFTFYIKNGYMIEDGKLTAPIKDINIIGNGPRVLEKVEMVGNDLKLDEGGWTCGKRGQGVPVSLGLPTVKVSSITIGGTKKSAPDADEGEKPRKKARSAGVSMNVEEVQA